MHLGHGYRAAQPRGASPDFNYSTGVPTRFFWAGTLDYHTGVHVFADGVNKSSASVYNASLVAFEWNFTAEAVDGVVHTIFMRDGMNPSGPGRFLIITVSNPLGQTWTISGVYQQPVGNSWNNMFITDIDFDVIGTGGAADGCFLFRGPVTYSEE